MRGFLPLEHHVLSSLSATASAPAWGASLQASKFNIFYHSDEKQGQAFTIQTLPIHGFLAAVTTRSQLSASCNCFYVKSAELWLNTHFSYSQSHALSSLLHFPTARSLHEALCQTLSLGALTRLAREF